MKDAACAHIVLFVAGASPQSTKAIRAFAAFVSDLPAGECRWEIVDVYREPKRAREAGVLTAPSLVVVNGAERRVLAGDIASRIRARK